MATGNTTFLNPGKSIPSDPKNSTLKSINLAPQKKRSNFSTSISWSFRKCAKTADLNSAVCLIFRSVIHHDFTFLWPRTLSHISWVARSACFPVAPTLDLHSKQTSLSVCSFGCRQSSIHKKHNRNNEKLKKTWVDTVEISSIHVCKPKAMMSYKSISLSCKKRHTATRRLHLWLQLRLRQESGYSSSGALSPCADCVCPAPVTSLQQHLMFMYILIRSQKSLVYTYIYAYIIANQHV